MDDLVQVLTKFHREIVVPDKLALRSELLDLKARVDGLQEQIQVLETRLAE